MQRLGRAAAVLLQAHRSLLAAGAVQQQQHATAAAVQRLSSSLSSSLCQQQAAHHSLAACSQLQLLHSSSNSSADGHGQLAALAQLLSCRTLATSASRSSSSSSSSSLTSPSKAVPAAPAVQQPAQPQDHHQQQQPQTRGPIEGICRRRNIKLGWKKLDFVLRMVRRSFVDDALSQLAANPKKAAVFALHAIANARNNAICAGGDPAKLWVAEAFVTKGRYRKYMAIMGRGNTGIKETRYSHLNVKVRQLDDTERSKAKAILRRRPLHVAPLVQRLQQGRRGRAVGQQVQQLQQWQRRQQQAS